MSATLRAYQAEFSGKSADELEGIMEAYLGDYRDYRAWLREPDSIDLAPGTEAGYEKYRAAKSVLRKLRRGN